ncbi:unnamed protein product [Lactuca virosa]|uniref:Uncharacterized protein n=1 Tax=Lactuca virosa TaxID=75947 RepID=A0AAU9MYD8_9ASTR|nr:unnamed protein product [Lactuca virosa]
MKICVVFNLQVEARYEDDQSSCSSSTSIFHLCSKTQLLFLGCLIFKLKHDMKITKVHILEFMFFINFDFPFLFKNTTLMYGFVFMFFIKFWIYVLDFIFMAGDSSEMTGVSPELTNILETG